MGKIENVCYAPSHDICPTKNLIDFEGGVLLLVFDCVRINPAPDAGTRGDISAEDQRAQVAHYTIIVIV